MSFWLQIHEALISPSKSREDTTIAECPQSAHMQDEHPLQVLPENPPQTDHLEKGQSTELPIPSENITVPIQNETPDNYPTSNSDRHFVHSAMSNQPFCPNQGIAVQAPFDLDITLPAMFPSIQDIKKDDSEELKGHRENDEIQSAERSMVQLQDQTTDTKEADNIESSLQESTQHCPLNELITASASKAEGDFSHSTEPNILVKESHEPLLENLEMQMIKPDKIVRREPSGKEQAGLKVGEVPGMIATCMFQPLEPTDLGHTREDSVIRKVPSPPRTPEIEVTECQQQSQGTKPKLKEVLEVLFVNVDTPSGPESAAPKDESPALTSLFSATATSQSLTSTVQAVAPEGGDGKPSMTLEEPLSNEEFELYYDDPASFQKQEGLRSQPALPYKTLKASNAEVDVVLSKTLIPSFAFLSVTICLVVGFHEPSIFLIMTLFLVSLCF